jgi:alpha-1,3-rhamnosyl/mannosyltransferase
VTGGAVIRVGVNLLWMVPGVVGGTEDGTVALLHALADARDDGTAADLDVVLFGLEPLRRAHPALLERFEHRLVRLDGRAKAMRVLTETVWLPVRARSAGIEVMHHAGGVAPFGTRRATGAAVVLTVHDVQVLELPEYFAPVKRRYLQTMLPRSVRAADILLTATEYAARTVVEHLHVPPDKIRASPFGRPHPIERWPSAEEQAETRRRYRLPGPYFLYPAITYPHKNHAVLLEAFARLLASLDGTDADTDTADAGAAPVLVLSGAAGGEEATVAAQIERLGIGQQVRRVGRIPRRDLDVLLSDATALTFPSRYEGFGLPAIEAMTAGCPLIASTAAALPEVVGDGGVLVSPDDPDEWTRAMRELLDPDCWQAMRERGLRRASHQRFSPARAATDLADAYRAAAAVRSGSVHR